jgi:hypothetical protein
VVHVPTKSLAVAAQAAVASRLQIKNILVDKGKLPEGKVFEGALDALDGWRPTYLIIIRNGLPLNNLMALQSAKRELRKSMRMTLSRLSAASINQQCQINF